MSNIIKSGFGVYRKYDVNLFKDRLVYGTLQLSETVLTLIPDENGHTFEEMTISLKDILQVESFFVKTFFLIQVPPFGVRIVTETKTYEFYVYKTNELKEAIRKFLKK